MALPPDYPMVPFRRYARRLQTSELGPLPPLLTSLPTGIVTNLAGLIRLQTAHANMIATTGNPVIVQIHGDSIPSGVGIEDPGNVINNDVSDNLGWPGQMRANLATFTGFNKGGIITPQFPGTADARVTKAGTTNILTTGPMNSGVQMTSVSNAGGPGFVTMTLPICTQIDILLYQSTSGSPTTGALTYSVDGGADVPIPNTNNGYTVVKVTGLSSATHTITVKGASSTNASYFFGVRYSMGKGVVVGRFARPGWTILDAFGLGTNANLFGNAGGLARVADQWGSWGAHCTIITFNHNDCGYSQDANPSGIYSTTANYRTYLQTAINTAVAKGGCVLLYAPQLPPVQTPPVGGEDFLAYHEVMRQLALSNTHVAFLDAHDRVGTVQAGLDSGFYASPSTVHPSPSGHAVMGDYGADAYKAAVALV